MKNKILCVILKALLILSIILVLSVIGFLFYLNKTGYFRANFLNSAVEEKTYTAEDFGIETVLSGSDYNQNGIDDYTDILLGARQDAQNKPKYKSAYYIGGYPPDDEGVCTDVIWRAFKNAGYSLKDLVDEDIKNNVAAYPRVEGNPDPNIDFRRVPNLKVYFERNHISLTTDLTKIEEWQPGDIVVFGSDHIGIISDIRNELGIPYLIDNGGQDNRESNRLEVYNEYKSITGHYRFKP